MTPLFESFQVKEFDQVGEVRRRALRLSNGLEFDRDLSSNIGILVTELATNLVKHTKGGQILIGAIDETLSVISLDKGPGFGDFALRDGFSTRGTQGSGLGAVLRLASQFDYYSSPETGSVIATTIWQKESHVKTPATWFAIRVSAPGEIECGDNYSVIHNGPIISVLVVDGLGHGPQAAAAADLAVELNEDSPFAEPESYLQLAHERLRPTRGAVGLKAIFDTDQRTIRYAGVGNISGCIASNFERQSFTSHNGSLGGQVGRTQEFRMNWEYESLVILHSDGLMTKWNLNSYPGLSLRTPQVIAAVLYRDYLRGRDDATVLVLRLPAENKCENTT